MLKNTLRNIDAKKLITQLLYYMVGIILVPFGVNLQNNSGLGIGGYDSLNYGIAERLGVSVTIAVYITAAMALVISALLARRVPRVTTFITSILQGFMMGFWQKNLAFLQPTQLPSKILIFALGMLLSGIGIGIYISPGWPPNPTDELIVVMNKELKWSIGVSKIVFDIITCVLALLIGQKLGIGTLVLTFLLGFWIDFVNKHAKKFCPTSFWRQA